MNIIQKISSLASKHVGDKFLKEIYALSLLTPGIQNIEEPLHIFLYGSPESGKTNISTTFLDLVPKEHKDVASDFTPRVLMYSKLKPSTVITINDKILNDSMGSIINQVCDSAAWRKGKIIATTIGSERIDLIFPARCLMWINANKHIMDYNLREVDPLAIVGRFSIYEKTYSDAQKKHIFLNRNVQKEEDNEQKIEEIQKYINDIYEHPKIIICSEELRNIIWDKSQEIGTNSLRSIGRNLSMCQVVALTNDRLEVTKEDIEAVFNLLKTEEKPIKKIETSNIKDISDSIKKYLVNKTLFETFSVDKKLQYSSPEIQKKFKVSDICAVLDNMEENKVIGKEILKVGTDRVQTQCYYLI